MTDQQWRWVFVILSIPGMTGFFLPFTSVLWTDVSPLEAATWLPDNFENDLDGFARWFYRSLGAVMGLAIFIFGWRLRLAISDRLSHLEIVGCVVLGLAGSLLLAGNYLYAFITANSDDV